MFSRSLRKVINHQTEKVTDNGKTGVPKSVELENEEHIVLVSRQHWIVFRNPILLSFFVPFVLLYFSFMIGLVDPGDLIEKVFSQVAIYGSLLSFVLGLLNFIWRYYLWKNTYYVVTNKRLILVNQLGLFSHDDRETSLTMIQDVRAQINGFQATMYGYGDVTVQVSSEDAQLTFERVAYPKDVQHTIIKEAHLR